MKPLVTGATGFIGYEVARQLAAAGVRTFVYASSLLVYGSSPGPIGPGTPTGPRLDYGRAKVEAEVALASVARRAAMKLAVLRLPHVYGARDPCSNRYGGDISSCRAEAAISTPTCTSPTPPAS